MNLPVSDTCGPTLHRYREYGWLRGFSVIPSWGARIEDAWWFYDGRRMREEVALATQVHANCIRLWIEFSAWMRDPDLVTQYFLDAVAAIDEAGMKTMPVLFNRWHDADYDYGGTYTETLAGNWEPLLTYVTTLVTPLARDERILMWDLCNEPQALHLESEVNRREYAFLEAVAGAVRSSGAQSPLTIGTMFGPNVELYAPLVDVLCVHPYAHEPEPLRSSVREALQMGERHNKPVIANETLPGALRDEDRAQLARWYTRELASSGLGWMGWALKEGAAISTRRDRYDRNGINQEGFHPFFTAAGQLRAGLEFLTEAPSQRPPWTSSSA